MSLLFCRKVRPVDATGPWLLTAMMFACLTLGYGLAAALPDEKEVAGQIFVHSADDDDYGDKTAMHEDYKPRKIEVVAHGTSNLRHNQ